MRFSSLKDRKGVTLLEIIIVIGILGTVTFSVFSLMMHSNNAAESLRKKSSSQQDYRYIAAQLTEELRLSSEVSASYKSGMKVIDKESLEVEALEFTRVGSKLIIKIQKDDIEEELTLYLENIDDSSTEVSEKLYYR